MEPGHGGVGLETTVELNGKGERFVSIPIHRVSWQRMSDGGRNYGEQGRDETKDYKDYRVLPTT